MVVLVIVRYLVVIFGQIDELLLPRHLLSLLTLRFLLRLLDATYFLLRLSQLLILSQSVLIERE